MYMYNWKIFLRFIRFKTFEEEINKKSDTLYIVSFRGVSSIPILGAFVRFSWTKWTNCSSVCFIQDHLVFPATEYNATQRPKMSFMIMAPPNSKLKFL